MTDDEKSELRTQLQTHNPHKVKVYLDDELRREVPVPTDTRKKWTRVLEVLASLRWTSAELCDKTGGTLHVYTPASVAPREAVAGELATRDAELLKLLISAQREVLTYRERESAAALNAATLMLDKLTSSVSNLVTIQNATIDAARTQAATQLAAIAAAPAAPEATAEELESMQMFKAMAPALMKAVVDKYGPGLLQALMPSSAPAPKAKVIDIDPAKGAK